MESGRCNLPLENRTARWSGEAVRPGCAPRCPSAPLPGSPPHPAPPAAPPRGSRGSTKWRPPPCRKATRGGSRALSVMRPLIGWRPTLRQAVTSGLLPSLQHRAPQGRSRGSGGRGRSAEDDGNPRPFPPPRGAPPRLFPPGEQKHRGGGDAGTVGERRRWQTAGRGRGRGWGWGAAGDVGGRAGAECRARPVPGGRPCPAPGTPAVPAGSPMGDGGAWCCGAVGGRSCGSPPGGGERGSVLEKKLRDSAPSPRGSGPRFSRTRRSRCGVSVLQELGVSLDPLRPVGPLRPVPAGSHRRQAGSPSARMRRGDADAGPLPRDCAEGVWL